MDELHHWTRPTVHTDKLMTVLETPSLTTKQRACCSVQAAMLDIFSISTQWLQITV
jgi:hypothetical protein